MIVEQQNELHDLPEVQKLLETGVERGMLSLVEIADTLIDLDLDAGAMEEILRILEAEGVELIDEPAKPAGPTAAERRMAYEGTTDSLQLFLHEEAEEERIKRK